LVNVLSGSEVDTTPSVIPEDLVVLDTVHALPLESDRSEAASFTLVHGGNSVGSSVGPSGHLRLSWRYSHVDDLS
jgi:hypothetical protein